MGKYEGVVTKINYIGKNDWCALRVKLRNGDTVGASGCLANPANKQEYVFEGELEEDAKYGLQLKFTKATLKITKTTNGVVRYLSSGDFQNIGQTLAQRIVKQFGPAKTLEIIEKHPEELRKVKGLSDVKINALLQGVKRHKINFELQKLTNGHLTYNQLQKIINEYGEENSMKVLKTNPYSLIYDIDGIGFAKADAIAKGMGIETYNPFRIEEGIVYTLKNISDNDGHTFAYLDDLKEYAINILFPINLSVAKQRVFFRNYENKTKQQNTYDKAGFSNKDYDAIKEYQMDMDKKHSVIEEAIAKNIENGKIIEERDNDGKRMIYWKKMYYAERNCAEILSNLSQANPIKQISNIEEKIKKFEEMKSKELDTDFVLEDEQKEAIRNALTHRLSVITGGAGVGKTTILECILDLWADEDTICLSAPTGKASQRMREATGRPATTIHLRIAREEEHSEELVIIDESSMIDIALASKTLDLFEDCQIIFIGDVNQLPSVGAGAFFQDLCKSPYIHTSRLIKGHRNQGNIAKNSKRINTGKSERHFSYGKDFIVTEIEKEDLLENVIMTYMKYRKEYSVDKVMILCPQRQAGTTCVNRCNEAIEKRINPEGKKIPNTTFRVGDRVMCTRNNHSKKGMEYTEDKSKRIEGIFNGDIGSILKYDEMNDYIYFQTDDNRLYIYPSKEMEDFVLCYAMTIHKSQGSEYPVVIMPFNMESYMMLKRNILYTGVTRAKKHIEIMGNVKAINMAVRNTEYNERNTMLLQRIANKI